MKSWQSEIVHVLDQHVLTDSTGQTFPYHTRNGTELDCGHYLVLKMAETERQYLKGVVFFGPFISEMQAEMVLHSSRFFGLLTGKIEASRLTPPLHYYQNDSRLPLLLRRRDLPHPPTNRGDAHKGQRPF
ncbi:MAG: hypothetical protein WCC58_03910 [Burkholderiales bacterium]